MRLYPRLIFPALIPLILCLLQPACDDEGGSSPRVDSGAGTDAAAGADGSSSSDVPAASAACPTLVTTMALTGAIDTDQTWRGAVAVTGEVNVGMAKITIEPGTTFVMGADSSIAFGWNSNTGSLFARGTEAAPIRFCGKTAQAGYWDKISIGDRITSDSVLEQVIVSEGGQGTGAALELQAPVLVKNVQIQRSGADGVHAADFKEGSERLTISGAVRMPLVLLKQGAVTRLPLGGSYGGNGMNVVGLRFTSVDVDTTFRNPGLPYIQELTVTTQAGAKITFEAGVDYRLAVDQELEFGWNGNEATVLANGTADKPVLFGRVSDSAGGFRSIIFGNRVRSDSVLRYVKIRGGGNGGAALDIRAPLTIDHLTLEANQTGLELAGAGFSPSSTTLTITTTAGAPATVQPDNAITLPRGGSFTGNMKDWISIEAGAYTATGTLPNLGVPYRIEGAITTQASSLTIEAGTTFIMAADSGIEFGWNGNEATVMAVGTAASPIVFKGADEGAAGYWAGLTIQSSVRSASKFAYVDIRNGGQAAGAALSLRRAMFDVTNSKFARSAGVGIRKPATDTTDYSLGGNTFELNAMGTVDVW